MSAVYVTSDWHFGHRGIIKYRTQFPSTEYMEDYVLGQTLSIVTKRDTLYCLGDMAFDMRGLEKLHQLPCRKILIRGNHDNHLTTEQFLSVFESVEGAYRYKKYWFTHIPIHPSELYRGKNIHGHCHRGGPAESRKDKEWYKYYNAILEFNDYMPVNVQEVGRILAEREQSISRRR